MSVKCKELKRISREKLMGHYHIPILGFIISNIVAFFIELPFAQMQKASPHLRQTIILCIVDVLVFLIYSLFMCGEYRIHLQLARGAEPSLQDLFWPFKNRSDRYLKSALLLLLITFFTNIPLIVGLILYVQFEYPLLILILCGLVSLILGAFVYLRFQLVFFLLLDHEEMTTLDSFKISSGCMRKQMGHLLYLYLSFVGIQLLSIFSLGIGTLWTYPYQLQTLTTFYLSVTRQVL